MPDYSKQQLWQLYDALPKELQKAVFSPKNADHINEICLRNKIEQDEKISQVAKYTGYVLLGIVMPDKFQNTLEKEVKLQKTKAEKIAVEINKFIFLPNKKSLDLLYKREVGSKNKTENFIQINKEKSKKTDSYREVIE